MLLESETLNALFLILDVILGLQRSLDGQTLDSLLLLYSLSSQLSFDMDKAIVKTFSFQEVIQVIRGRKRSLEGQTLNLMLLLYSLGSQLLFDMQKDIVKTFSFLEVIQVIRGRKRSLEGQTLNFFCYCIPWVPSFRLICIKPQLIYFLFVEVIRGHQSSLKFNLI